MDNVVLIGMPGAGKSTIGVLLAKSLLMDFVDTDLLIQQKYSSSLCDIINKKGIEEFLKTENDVICSKSFSNCVIATGGGVVTRPENLPILRQNSVTVLLHRPVEELPSDGRPLSQKYGVKALYEKRKPLYEQFGEYTVECTGVEETVDKILEVLGL